MKKTEFQDKHMNFYHPPMLPMPDIPVPNHYGAYMQPRKHSIHTGVDLYAPDGTPVYAVEKGRVVVVKWYTGENNYTPWWNDTQVIFIKGYTGTIGYGEIEPLVKEGDMVYCGQHIANVKTVLKKDKGKAMSMLHFTLRPKSFELVHNNPEEDDYNHDLPLDPTIFLLQLKSKADIMDLKYEMLTKEFENIKKENQSFVKSKGW